MSSHEKSRCLLVKSECWFVNANQRWFTTNILLVGGLNPSEQYYIVNWGDYSQYMEKIKNVPNHQPVFGSKTAARSWGWCSWRPLRTQTHGGKEQKFLAPLDKNRIKTPQKRYRLVNRISRDFPQWILWNPNVFLDTINPKNNTYIYIYNYIYIYI